MKRKVYTKPCLQIESFIPQEYIATCYTLYCHPDEYTTHYTKVDDYYLEKSGEKRTHGFCMDNASIYNNLTQHLTGADSERSITKLLLNIKGTSGDKSTYTEVTTETSYPTLKELFDKNDGKIEAYWIEHDPHHPKNETGPAANWYHYGHVSKLSGFS